MRQLLLAVGVLSLTVLSACNVNEYCLNCATEDGGGNGDGGSPDAIRDGGGMPDACIPNGVEVCDGLDNDCDGDTDEDVATVGDACGANVGVCTVGEIVCDPDDGLSCTGDALQAPESCDDLDNDCDGTVDDNNPEGGERCGTDLGDCVAGFTMCITGGVLDCVGDMGTMGGVDEECDGRDNDCDGDFDEDLPSMGSCGATDVGECVFGTLMCVGGGPQCVDYVGPTFEACDTTVPMPLDSDCDGFDHNGYDLDHDVNNCGACGDSCVGTITNATAICDNMCVGGANAGRGCNVVGDCPGGTCGGGDCVPGNCNPGFYDIAAGAPGTLNEGCEYECDFQGPQEDCNSEDDNCNGVEDEGLIPPPICVAVGACMATTATCEVTGPTSAWDCNYGPDVSTDGSGNIIPETECDGVDNDCDGHIDEGDPVVTSFTSCNDTAVGVCQRFGHMVCDPLDEDAAPICSLDLTVPIVDSGGTAPSATDTCDGLDNDCDGLIDDNTISITTAVCGAGVATITTSTPHTMVTGQSVTIRGVSVGAYNVTINVASTPTTTTFTYPLACPGMAGSGGTANGTNAASRSALQTWVPIGGTAPNETFIMAYEASRPNAANPDSITRVITTITRAASGVVTVTTGTAHGFAIGSTVVIAGVTDTSFAGNFVVTATPTTTTFRYAQDPDDFSAATSSGGTASKAIPAIGTQTTHACSKAGVQPWVIIDQPDAETACAAVGGRMCTEQEWHQACAGRAGRGYPVDPPGTVTVTSCTRTAGGVATCTTPVAHGFAVGDGVVVAGNTNNAFNLTNITVTAVTTVSPFTFTFTGAMSVQNGTGGTAGNGKVYFEAEDYATITTATSGGVLRTWVPDYSTNTAIGAFFGISAMRSSPNTGANLDATTTLTQGPRLNYTVNFSAAQGATGWSVWVRSYAPNGNDNAIFVGISSIATLQAISPATTWTWQRLAFAAPGTGVRTITIYMDEDGAKVDALLITQSTVVSPSIPPDTSDNGNDFPYNNTYSATTCNGEDFDGDVFPTNAGDQDDVIATGSTLLPSCKAEWGAQDVFDMSGNAKEWTLERLPGSNPIRGGASNNEAAGLTCSNAFTLADDEFFFNNVGFRCCKGP